jgi:hypothetical protein
MNAWKFVSFTYLLAYLLTYTFRAIAYTCHNLTPVPSYSFAALHLFLVMRCCSAERESYAWSFPPAKSAIYSLDVRPDEATSRFQASAPWSGGTIAVYL